MKGALYLAAYDISEPRTQNKALRFLRARSFDKQKSVFECRLLRRDRDDILDYMASLIDKDTDRFMLTKVDVRGQCIRLGCAPALVEAKSPLILIG